MNCRNCGGTMKLVDGRDYFVCEFCTSFHFPNPAEKGPDGVVVLGEESDCSCPICTIPMVAGSVAKQRVLYCEKCRGFLASNDAFVLIVRNVRSEQREPAEKPRSLNPEELERIVRCPGCNCQMDVHPYYGPGNIVVDSCHRCHLIWLDHGELNVIRHAPGRA